MNLENLKMTLQKKKILVGIPEITHRQIASDEVEGLKKLGFYVTTSLYGGVRGVNTNLFRLYVIFKNAYSIINIVRKEKIDLIYLNTAFDKFALLRDFTTLLILRLIRSKIVLKFHGSEANLLQTKNIIYRFLIRKVSSWADGFGVLSTEENRNFVNAGFKSEKVFVIKNIINPKIYLKNMEFRLKYSNINIPVLLFVARLIPSKGLIDTLLASIILKEKGYIFKLIILGDGPDKIKAERIVAKSNIASSVIFTGFIPEENTTAFYANSDLLVFPTYHEEGFPMAVFQSVAAGLPIITTKIRAAADYLKEPDNCLWVEPKNPEMLAEKIVYLLENPDIARQMSENNKKLSKLFTQEIVCKELELIYEKMLK